MIKIGLISDTHNYLHPKIFNFFKNCDEIWHAGDIGNIDITEDLKIFKPLRAVYGNMDDFDVRHEYPQHQIFQCEDVKVFMTHIGGYPNNYYKPAKDIILKEKPDLFICGHSHILKIIYDKKYNLLHINPGAAGKTGYHKKITFVRFCIDKKEIKDLEIMEIDRK
ncbi:MAG: metallophosphoesterase family protein [Bacteroidales bacterium]|nr:metallophosphoesterase family protein [Bacteroidales bacterium]